MTVWIDADQVSATARNYLDQATSLRIAAARLRGDQVGEWGADVEIAAFGAAFARLTELAADELRRYALATEGLGDALSGGSTRLVEADLSWGH
ncbi:hypothetical protein GOEFS_078_00030 [Gordonia effusa NBRC 100432]|uniref:Uncharacterized protein n=1 Tax=Gordonia effusa NBRC 100432 TaxID=1077974 RepID=H0R2G8_9ACTN|nr:hypothetical protein [Gordonia effusa]GAB19269.1 hypothetical protein GOEFS_078_00030 [Gordonia effusa NBRC 100432]